VLKVVANAVPLCVAGVRDYLVKYGAPPYVVKLAGEMGQTKFDHLTSEWIFDFVSKPSNFSPATKIFIATSRYPFGVDVIISPAEKSLAKWIPGKDLLVFKTAEAPLAKVTLTKRQSGRFTITFNGKQLYPVTEPPPSISFSQLTSTFVSSPVHYLNSPLAQVFVRRNPPSN